MTIRINIDRISELIIYQVKIDRMLDRVDTEY